MAKRRKHSPEEIVRKLQTAERLATEAASSDEIARELGVSTATIYSWRNRYGAMDVNEAKVTPLTEIPQCCSLKLPTLVG